MMSKGQQTSRALTQYAAGLYALGGVGKWSNPTPLQGGALASLASSNLAAASIKKGDGDETSTITP
jgi:hypothetical protein